MNAKSKALKLKDGIALLEGADTLIVAKGKKVERFDLRDGLPDRSTLERVLLGPTGNLRAPTLRRGRTVVVGFDEATYKRLFA